MINFVFNSRIFLKIQSALKQANNIVKYIRITPYDLSTSNGRESERHRRAILTTITSILAKGITILTGFISIPLTVNYLGVERFGLWMTITSISMMFVFADFGLGNGLVNVLAKANGKNEKLIAKEAVSNVFFMQSFVALFLILIFGLTYKFISWSNFFNVTTDLAIQESAPAVMMFFLIFAFKLPTAIVQKIQIAYQEGFISNLWQAGGSILSLIALLVAINYKAGLTILIFSMTGVETIVMIINLIYQFLFVRNWIAPSWKLFKLRKAKILLRIGLIFSIITLANIIGSSLDNIIIANYMGASSVSEYAVVQKLFSIMFIVTFITAPYWPAFGEAFAQLDYIWARKTQKKIQKISFYVTILLCLPLLVFGKFIIKIWIGPEIIPSFPLLIGFSFFWIASGFAQSALNVMQTDHYIRRLLIVTIIYSIISIILKIVFIQIWGLPGIIWAGGISYGLLFTIPITLFVNRELKAKANTYLAA